MDPRQTTTEEPSPPAAGTRRELLSLVRALRGQLEDLEASGAWGLPPAPRSQPPVAAAGSLAGVSGAAPPARESVAAGLSADHAAAAPPSPAPRVPARPSAPAGPAQPVHLPQASLERLRALADEARSCTRCGLHEGRHRSVFARGGGSSGLVFVGEGPGEEEDRQGSPFVGPAGQLLDRMIAAMQFDRDDVYVCNIVKCRPPKNRKPEPDEMARCMPFLAEQLEILEPRVIVALGATAVQGLLGTTEGITRLRGQWKLYRGKVPVMPTFHPAYLLRTPQAKRDVWKDLQEVLRHLKANAPQG